MSVVYLITAGSYSDYRVVVATLDKTAADEMLAFLNRDDRSEYSIEEFELVGSLSEAKPRERWTVRVDAKGEERHSYVEYNILADEEEDSGYAYSPWDPVQGGAEGSSYRGHDVALKVARDALAERKAKTQGIT